MSGALVLLALLPFAGAAVPALVRGRFAFPAAVTLVAATLVLGAALLAATPAGEAIVVSRPWVPALDLTLALRLDRLSGATTLLIALGGLGALWRLRTRAGGEPVAGTDSALIVLFVGLMQALVLAENALLVVALAELGALAAFALERERPAGEGPARVALYARSAGSLFLLGAVLLAADSAGSFEFGAVFAAAASIRAHSLYPLLLGLLLAAAWLRAAAWPWIGWPRGGASGKAAMAGFTGAALLATGVYVAIRFSPLLASALPLAVVGSGFVVMPLLVAALGSIARSPDAAQETPASAAPVADARAHE